MFPKPQDSWLTRMSGQRTRVLSKISNQLNFAWPITWTFFLNVFSVGKVYAMFTSWRNVYVFLSTQASVALLLSPCMSLTHIVPPDTTGNANWLLQKVFIKWTICFFYLLDTHASQASLNLIVLRITLNFNHPVSVLSIIWDYRYTGSWLLDVVPGLKTRALPVFSKHSAKWAISPTA